MMAKNKILITGVTGQDGAILADILSSKGFDIYGASRRNSHNLWRINELDLANKISFLNYDATDVSSIDYILSKHKFDSIFHFAGSSFTVDSLEFPQNTLITNINGTLSLLEAARKYSPASKIFIAGSSEVFSRTTTLETLHINEKSFRSPVNPYGVSHLAIDALVEIYRKTHGLKISLGIFFNHESKFRSLQFVTRKITSGLAQIKNGNDTPLKLGNFSACRDWSCAVEFMEGASSLIENSIFGDFVFASGKSTTVRELLTQAAKAAGFKPSFEGIEINEVCIDSKTGKILAVSDKKFYRETDPYKVVGDSSLILKATGWRPNRNILEVVEEMTFADIKRASK
jgi:GDPmannose 4,6-dehydratase